MISGARTVDEVAEELKGLTAAAVESATESSVQGRGSGSALTWDEMEKLVLGRALTAGVAGSPKSTDTPPSLGTRARRLAADRERARKRWWIVVSSTLGVLAVAMVAILVFGGLQCDLDSAQAGSTTVTSEPVDANVDAPLVPTTTTTSTTVPPVTLPPLDLPDYVAQLSGSEAIPAVDSEAGGSLELTLSEDGQSVDYVFTLENIDGLTLANLRVGEVGETGDKVFAVYPGPTKEGVFSGVVAEGSFGPDDFLGPLKGKTMADFIALLDEQSVYLIVGTTAHRGGEIRGQLE